MRKLKTNYTQQATGDRHSNQNNSRDIEDKVPSAISHINIGGETKTHIWLQSLLCGPSKIDFGSISYLKCEQLQE